MQPGPFTFWEGSKMTSSDSSRVFGVIRGYFSWNSSSPAEFLQPSPAQLTKTMILAGRSPSVPLITGCRGISSSHLLF